MFFLYSVRNLIMADVDLRNMLCATRQHLAVLVLLMSSIFFFPPPLLQNIVLTQNYIMIMFWKVQQIFALKFKFIFLFHYFLSPENVLSTA